ncbi:kinase-like domain-containing protein, partial [Tribonema minus]
VLHRDLKSLNVLIFNDWTATLCDFGFAELNSWTTSTMSKQGKVIGTYNWTAPEVIRDEHPKKTPPANVYSTGMVIYEILSTKVPLAEHTLLKVARAVTEQQRPSVP